MRVALIATSLIVALMTIQPGVAQPLPATPGSAVCVPPGTLNQVCAGRYYDGRICVWPSGASGLGPTCLPPVAVVSGDPVCVPPGSLNNMCVGLTPDGSHVCAWINGGPYQDSICAGTDGTVTACSNNWFGNLYGPGWHCLGEPLG